MEKGMIRERFLDGCNRAAEPLQQNGFRCLQKGQCWKKTSDNKDMTYAVYFDSSHYNSEKHIACQVRIYVYSKQTKAMEFAQTQGLYNDGYVFFSYLSDNPHCFTEWNFADDSKEIVAENEIASLIKQYVLPAFGLFENPNTAVEWLKKSPRMLNDWMHTSIPFALSFMMIHGGVEGAEAYMNRFLSLLQKPFRERVKQWYQRLNDVTAHDFSHQELSHEWIWRLAYIYGVRIAE